MMNVTRCEDHRPSFTHTLIPNQRAHSHICSQRETVIERARLDATRIIRWHAAEYISCECKRQPHTTVAYIRKTHTFYGVFSFIGLQAITHSQSAPCVVHMMFTLNCTSPPSSAYDICKSIKPQCSCTN